MDSMDTFDSSYDFIELNRTFHEISKEVNKNDDVDISQAVFGEILNWSNLINEYRIVILSEAGSGKTAEISHVACKLRDQGKSAFFLRLEHIHTDFEDAFEVGTYEAFEEWRTSSDHGWLFLDSVDEARLRHPGDFELAIRNLSRQISAVLDRTHIYITSRMSAWRPKTDLNLCEAKLPYPIAAISNSDPQAEDVGPEGSLHITTDLQDRDKPTFRIVSLNDLSSDQIALFVEARGIEKSKVFLDAVERADAKWYTSRPQDLEELTEFWIDNGRIGTRLEIIQNSINRRLAERDQGRADVYQLSADQARQGARLLAAATTLTHNPTIRVPDGLDNTKGIAVQSILSDWDNNEQLTLLSRPIFDVAIYGTVRFHHRSVREYLTAEWFAELLKRETSRRNIESLFFRNQYGMDIVVPTLRPILPWLAIMDGKILERVRKVAPEIIFEGGDPVRLPVEVRRQILREVCKLMSDGVTGRSARSFEAVQRFAKPDLTDEIRELIRQYADNNSLTEYLLRMVWLGELTEALPEAMKVALMPNAEKYARLSAFNAVSAIGSKNDQEYVRQSFLTEAAELNREWLAELLKDLQPTELTSRWLLACLEKSETKVLFLEDHLTDAITKFVAIADIELLSWLVNGLNSLLDFPPIIAQYCEVSEKFQWLIIPVCKAVERLILIRHPASLEPDALAILRKCSAIRGHGSNDLPEVKTEFSKLVSAWPELNRALFWFEVQKSREALDKQKRERLTDFWAAGVWRVLWKFEISDFDYVTGEISRQTFLDDKLVALSLAFHLYKAANRPKAWRLRLKKLVKGNDELSECLRNYLRPPAQSIELRRINQQNAKWKRLAEAQRKKQEHIHLDWKKFLNDNLDEVRAELRDKPGTITNSLWYLFCQARKINTTNRWTEYNWKTLIPEYGEEVAHFYRDGTVSFWRNNDPKIRSEGAPINETPWAVIIGLTGLEIEAVEVNGWPKYMNTAEVKLACKYASFELNGFPTWFPKLYEMCQKIVCDFLIQEIRYELSIERTESDTHYFIDKVSRYGQWELAQSIYNFLETSEPKNLSNLDKLLKILQGSTLSDELIETLASRKCHDIDEPAHLAHWFAIWISVAPEKAIAALKARIGAIADQEEQTFFAMTFVTHLFISHSAERRGDEPSTREAFKTPEHLKSLYLLMHEYIRSQDDIVHAGTEAYSPGLRDDAQDARNSLFNILNKIPGKESFMALIEIANKHPDDAIRPWMMFYAKTRAEQDGDNEAWSPSQVRDFYKNLERTPSNHRELAELATLRLLDLKYDLEHGDSSIASILKQIKQETDIRKYIGKELRDKAQGRYSIPQEEELADAKKPDLRFLGTGFDGPVPVELKLADNWTGPQLFERLENQLCGDYLRDSRSGRGLFVLVYRGEKSQWEVPCSANRVDFEGLAGALQEYWTQISPKFSNVDDIKVIGIDLTKRAS
ncbi:hypothetical protein HGB07_04840 [Candidatus Roizmanbacteria bacterium]|nr:hypothetical protein [Candidatus Roizmanbacteria bacterium]